jgi:hypothetical protein
VFDLLFPGIYLSSFSTHKFIPKKFELCICRGGPFCGTKKEKELYTCLAVRNYILLAQFEYNDHVVFLGNEKGGLGPAFKSVFHKLVAVV